MPVAGIVEIAFLAVQIRVYACTLLAFKRLHDLMSALPAALGVVPKCLQQSAHPRRGAVRRQRLPEFDDVHRVNIVPRRLRRVAGMDAPTLLAAMVRHLQKPCAPSPSCIISGTIRFSIAFKEL